MRTIRLRNCLLGPMECMALAAANLRVATQAAMTPPEKPDLDSHHALRLRLADTSWTRIRWGLLRPLNLQPRTMREETRAARLTSLHLHPSTTAPRAAVNPFRGRVADAAVASASSSASASADAHASVRASETSSSAAPSLPLPLLLIADERHSPLLDQLLHRFSDSFISISIASRSANAVAMRESTISLTDDRFFFGAFTSLSINFLVVSCTFFSFFFFSVKETKKERDEKKKKKKGSKKQTKHKLPSTRRSNRTSTDDGTRRKGRRSGRRNRARRKVARREGQRPRRDYA